MGGRVTGCSQRTCSLSKGKPSAVCLLESSFRKLPEFFSSWFTARHSSCLIDSDLHYTWMIWDYHHASTCPMTDGMCLYSSHTLWPLWFCTVGSRKALQASWTDRLILRSAPYLPKTDYHAACRLSACFQFPKFLDTFIHVTCPSPLQLRNLQNNGRIEIQAEFTR